MATLLIADSNITFRDIIVDILQPEFTIVAAVCSGKEIVDDFPALKPDIVVLDVSLDDRSGFDLMRELKNDGSECKFVFVSIYESESFVRAAQSFGASGYVFKSQISRDLLNVLQAVSRGGAFVASKMECLGKLSSPLDRC